MHKLFKPYMRKEDFWISHAQTFQAVHVKREFSDLTCTLAQSVPLRIYISQVIGYWETDTLWLKTDGHAKRKKQKTNR